MTAKEVLYIIWILGKNSKQTEIDQDCANNPYLFNFLFAGKLLFEHNNNRLISLYGLCEWYDLSI